MLGNLQNPEHHERRLMRTHLARVGDGGVVLIMAAVQGMESRVASGAEALQKGERIVFLGDSITQAGAGAGGYVALAKEELAKKYPDRGIEVIGAGISGNRVPDLEA